MKNIVIIGGGISGLTVLHYLKKKYAADPSVDICLLEKNVYPGGTAKTEYAHDCYFESGVNGFVDSQESTLRLAMELGLHDQLVKANEAAKKRFVQIQQQLHLLPSNPVEFLGFKPLSVVGKLRLAREFFVHPGRDPNESICSFGTRRLGKEFTDVFLDAMVSGIYGGTTDSLSIRHSFPRIYELEQKYGSLFRAMFALQRERKRHSREGVSPLPKGTLMSFRCGMSQLIDTMARKYTDHIRLSEEVKTIRRNEAGSYAIQTPKKTYCADQIFLCAPAYTAAKMMMPINYGLAQSLSQVAYAPLAVVGLLYDRNVFKRKPEGFGYLIPSSERKEILGVLVDSNLFVNRAPEGKVLLRVMIGGVRFPDVLAQHTREGFMRMAKQEIEQTFGVVGTSEHEWFAAFPNAIPQYNLEYNRIIDDVKSHVASMTGVFLCANYLGGIAFNNCTENARLTVERSGSMVGGQ